MVKGCDLNQCAKSQVKQIYSSRVNCKPKWIFEITVGIFVSVYNIQHWRNYNKIRS